MASEDLSWHQVPRQARPDTAAGHLQVLDEAIAALPSVSWRKLMVTCDGAGRDLVKKPDKLASRRGYQLICSAGRASAALTPPAGTSGARTGPAGPGKPTPPG